MDYGKWAGRLMTFGTEICRRVGAEVEAGPELGPPVAEEDLLREERALGVRLPSELRRFFAEAGGRVWFRYGWTVPAKLRRKHLGSMLSDEELFGRVCIDLKALKNYQRDCRRIAENLRVPGAEEELEFWLGTLPFMQMDDGDCLGLDITSGDPNPRVVYLAHDGPSDVIGETFSSFLEAYERVCYLGPDSFMLEPFRDWDTGHLVGTRPEVSRLRGLFGMAS